MYFISYDLGTGGVKASLYDRDFTSLAKCFIEYPTYYPADGWHEQRPEDWWRSVCQSTHTLLSQTGVDNREIACVALSGHSLVTVPIDEGKQVLLDQVPIWSDSRASLQADKFFQIINEADWYMRTGNGFPPSCYSLFKLMWLKENQPELFSHISKILGSKDYINFRLTNNVFTDHSYASGFGAYDLSQHKILPSFLDAAGIPLSIFPDIVPSHQIIGSVTAEASLQCGLAAGTPVACGGVDNACMALGAVGTVPGKVYVSLGSSSWIPVNSTQPVLDVKRRPYVFAHIQENMYTSAYSIFAGGSSLRWIRETICSELGKDAYSAMDQMADCIPVGANGVFFNPSLAGGTRQDKSPNIRGAFIGMHLGTTRADLIRSGLEGIALNLKLSLEALSEHVTIDPELLFCGGGSKSKVWMQMFADVFNSNIIKTNVDQDAASLGAAAICARACGLWSSYDSIPSLHKIENVYRPIAQNVTAYSELLPKFQYICNMLSDLGDYLAQI